MNNIEALRKARGLTRRELGERLGVQPPAIYKWERGRGQPQMETALRLADVFGVSLDCLMGRSVPRRRAPEEEAGSPRASRPQA